MKPSGKIEQKWIINRSVKIITNNPRLYFQNLGEGFILNYTPDFALTKNDTKLRESFL